MKTAIVTGGSKGIGLGVTKMLIGRGYQVFATYAHDEEAARRAEAELQGKAIYFKCDHSQREQTYAFVQFVKCQAKEIHCIICNAGTTIRHSFLETTDNDWDAMMEVAVNAHFILLREFFPLIQQHSRIIFTGSAMGIYPHATILGYGVSKTTIHGMVRNLTKVFEEKETTVNAVAPGFVETEWQKDKPEIVRQNINKKTAIHRFATIEEIVNAYEFCLDNAFVNGSIIEINGGYSYQ